MTHVRTLLLLPFWAAWLAFAALVLLRGERT